MCSLLLPPPGAPYQQGQSLSAPRAPVSTSTVTNQCTTRETAAEHSTRCWEWAQGAQQSLWDTSRGRCSSNLEGVRVLQAAGWVLRSPCQGWEVLPAADASRRAQRQRNQQSHVHVKPFAKVSQQIPSINPASLALAIQRGLIKLSL